MKRLLLITTGIMVLLVAGLALYAEGGANPKLPDGLKGFKGALTGTVGEVRGNGQAFSLKVAKAVAADGSKATDPSAAVGLTLTISAKWVKGTDGQWHPDEAQVAYIKSLKAGAQITITVFNEELTIAFRKSKGRILPIHDA